MREEEEKTREQVFSTTFALGILSHATAPHRYTLLHVCSAPAGVCWCFIGCFLFNSGRRVLSGLLGSGPVGFLSAETLSLLHHTTPLIPASNVDFQLKFVISLYRKRIECGGFT